jgi:beta-N-acetylhexosaminidase
MAARAFITGLAGSTLSADECAFLREAQPFGAIVFRRNVQTPEQLSALIAGIRAAVGSDLPVLVDQEGGRIQRLGPPHWPTYPSGAAYGCLYDSDPAAATQAARLGGRLISADLAAVGIDVDCAPLADVLAPEADAVIGDRAYGETAEKVASIAAAFAAGLQEGGVLPVLKHLPGHGRAAVDSHVALPVVRTPREALEATDFAAFRPLAGLPLGMTAHVVYSAIDPIAPATTSVTIVREVIRDSIGFQGLLMSDDVSMAALSGTIAARTRAALVAGCDLVLHCNGKMAEMQAVAGESPILSGASGRRAEAALAARRAPQHIDLAAARQAFSVMMAETLPAGARTS